MLFADKCTTSLLCRKTIKSQNSYSKLLEKKRYFGTLTSKKPTIQ